MGDNVKDLIQKLLVVDPTKRLTVKEALRHPWIVEGGHCNINRESTKAQLKKYNARRRFRGAIRAVQMGNILKRITASNSTHASITETSTIPEEAK